MDVKEAVQVAKTYISDLFGNEGIVNVGLEEVEFEEGTWRVTIGFSRPWDQLTPIAAIAKGGHPRSYKVVLVNNVNGRVTAVKNRETDGKS